MRSSWMKWAVPLGLGVWAQAASAQEQPPPAFQVITVPWVSTNVNVPRDAVNGQWHYFQAVARNCATTVQFRWDFDGDGTYDTNWTNAPNLWNLGARYTYPNQEVDRLFIARVQGRCGNNDAAASASAEFPIRVRVDPTRTQKVNRAVDNGLWYIHVNLARDTTHHTANWNGLPDTPIFAQAMMNRGHRAGIDPNIDPYYEDVLWMLHYTLTGYTRQNLAAQSQNVDPDVNGNGFGLRGGGNENYSGGPCLEAIASWGDMDYVIPDDIGIAEVHGRRLGDVVQDGAEYFYWSQTDIGFDGEIAGGWDYNANSGDIDTSQFGWASVALFAAEINGHAQVPDWVKTRVFNGVRYMDASQGGDQTLFGGYWYHHNSCGANQAHSGAMLNALGFALGRNADNDRVQATVRYIDRYFNAVAPDCWGGQNIPNYYAMYQISKGLRSFVPIISSIGDDQLDWYGAYVDFLLRTVNADGRWDNDNRWMSNRPMVHGLGLLILIPSVFEAPPVAVAEADPTRAGPGDLITFSHENSFNVDPTVPITAYRWNFIDYPDGLDANNDGDFDDDGDVQPEDLDGNGTVDLNEIHWEVETNDRNLRPTFTYRPDIAFGEEKTYPVTLQVEDQLGRTSIDNESVLIRVSIINHPPVALHDPSGNPNAVEQVVPGRTYTFDAGRSYDPDSDDEPQVGFDADHLTYFAWDLDGDGNFETEGQTVQFEIPGDWVIGQNRTGQLVVCDDGTWVGTPDEECEGGDCSLCSTRSFRFQIVPNQPPVAVIDPAEPQLFEGDQLVIDGSGSNDPEGGVLVYAWECDEDLPVQESDDGTHLTIDASAIDASVEGQAFGCLLTVVDDVGDTSSAEFTVNVVNRPPAVDGVDVAVHGEGAPVDVHIRASDASPDDQQILTYSVDCDGDEILDVIDSDTPDVQCNYPDNGTYSITVVVSDDDGGSTAGQTEPFDVPNLPPTVEPVECPPSLEGTPLVFQLIANDPAGDADPLTCTVPDPAPVGSAFNSDLCVVFWTPTYEQAIAGRVDFTAHVADDDGGSVDVRWTCRPTFIDEDHDGIPDTYERQHGLDPGRDDCNEDPDGDGLTNCQERDTGSDPFTYDGATPPVLISPIHDALVDTATPDLVLQDAHDGLGRPLAYEYVIYADEGLSQEVTRSDLIDETPQRTTWTVPAGVLRDDTHYWWTARAQNGINFGEYAPPASFTVNAVNQPPSVPRIQRPEDGDAVDRARPDLVVDNATDPDPGDTVSLECQIAGDQDFQGVNVAPHGPQAQGGATTFPLEEDLAEDQHYFARCRAVDSHGAASDWSDTVAFTVNSANGAPSAPSIVYPQHGSTIRMLDLTVLAGNSMDPEGDPLTYQFTLSTDPTFRDPSTLVSDEIPQGDNGQTGWVVPGQLRDNTVYFVRVRARDPYVAGPPATARFRVDLVNEAPSVPTPLNPANGTISEASPRFLWGASIDPEDDPITYEVELYPADQHDAPIWTQQIAGTFVDHPEDLEQGFYEWRIRAVDNQMAASDWSPYVRFQVEGEPVLPDAGPEADAALPDAAVPDAAIPDAAIPDAEVTPVDATIQPDMAVVSPDAAATGSDKVTGTGCECDLSAGHGAPGAFGLLLLIGLARAIRRREARVPARRE
jgi:MYXO-CTERM domain-containing protein